MRLARVNSHMSTRTEPHWKEVWRPTAAFVYLALCTLDFGLMPLLYEWMNHSVTNAQVVALAMQFSNATAQMEALHVLRQAHVWLPLTLQGGGMFHIAFGAILGVSAWTKGKERMLIAGNRQD